MKGVLMTAKPADIFVGNRQRKLDKEWVSALAESIRLTGRVHQPPLVRFKDDRMLLIAGEHRLAAAIEAGLEEIDVVAHDNSMTDAEALLIETKT